ncbi:MAG: shikimate kinase [SAR324 cluster bacterium]|nr:shikimate kinase [SAR324 cluster bacterium]
MNLIMIGFMGVGKTTIGRKLAKRLGYHFLDMDEQIENEQNRSISEIFENSGEDHFRQLEVKLLQKLSTVQNTVIATGGGAVATPGSLELMKVYGRLIYLKTSVDEIVERVKRSQHRPLLHAEDLEERISSLLVKRIPFYEQADYIIETKNLSPQRITSLIIRNL